MFLVNKRNPEMIKEVESLCECKDSTFVFTTKAKAKAFSDELLDDKIDRANKNLDAAKAKKAK
jgi:hypothetical protein